MKRVSIKKKKKANQTFCEKENYSRAKVSCIGFLLGRFGHSKSNVSCTVSDIVSGPRIVTGHILGLSIYDLKNNYVCAFLFETNIACPIKFMFLKYLNVKQPQKKFCF